MYARVSTLQGPGVEMDRTIDTTNREVVPAVKKTQGCKGIIVLGDRSSGRSISITLWDSEEAMIVSRETANRLRQQAADAEGAAIQSVEEFEVIIDKRG